MSETENLKANGGYKVESIRHDYEPMTADMRPQDINMDGSTLKFETLEHGGEYPDEMPQAIRITDTQGRQCTYVPITVDGEVVKSHGFYSASRAEKQTEKSG